MSDLTYTIAITEAERTALAKVLGALVSKLINAPVQIDSQKSGAPGPSTRLPAAAQTPQPPIELRDRWARDRKGNEVANPEGCEPIDVPISKTEQTAKYLRVSWQSNGHGFASANCFDSKLWPWIVAREKSGGRTRLYVVRKGNYLNVVGVRA